MSGWIFITGASSGIGRACAEMAQEKGYSVFAVARRKEKLSFLDPKKSVAAALDVRDRKQIAELAREHSKTFAQIKVLINNAGLARGMGPIQDGAEDDWEEMIDTNIKGLLWVTHALLPHLISNKGHIVNLGSVAGYWAYPKGNVYSSTKFAVRSLNESMRLDLSGTGVRVTEIAPGMVETEFSEVRFAHFSDARQKAKAVYAGMTPLTARDVAESVFWCLDRPAHVNVQELVIYPTDQASTTLVHRRS